jgi:hypothetical protein
VWVLFRVGDENVGQFDVEVLVDRVEGAANTMDMEMDGI